MGVSLFETNKRGILMYFPYAISCMSVKNHHILLFPCYTPLVITQLYAIQRLCFLKVGCTLTCAQHQCYLFIQLTCISFLRITDISMLLQEQV